MSQIIDLGKLRFHFAGDYDATTMYEVNDIVKYGGNVYVYTYGLKASGNLPTDTTYWALMVDGFKFQSVYDNSISYRPGDGVTHGGKVYICILETLGNTPPNTTYWSLFADGIQWESEYVNTTAYQKNDVVSYGGNNLYIAKVDTTGNLPTDTTYWEQFISGISADGVYNAATAYFINDIVAYGGNLYIAKGDTTGNLPSSTAHWDEFLPGVKNRGTYNNATAYALNDLVTYGASVYRATTETTGNLPTDTSYWTLYVNGINPKGTWATTTEYLPNDVVVYGGNNYRALVAHAGTTFATDLAANKWEKFNGGIDWKGNWTASGYDYKVDDVVKNNVSSYIALEDHTSGSSFATDLAAGKWELFAEGGDYVLPATAGNVGRFLSSNGTDYVWDDVVVESDTLDYFPSTISSSATWSTAGQRFSYDTLTIASGATYTISGTGSIHYVSTNGLVALV